MAESSQRLLFRVVGARGLGAADSAPLLPGGAR
jgi:hypothetical protein